MDEVRSIPILEIFDRYIGGHLRQRGRAFWTRCPWHGDDSTPSLKIYPHQNSWWCYGCQSGGSQIDMVMRSLEIDFKAAVKRICQDYNIDNNVPDKEARKRITETRNTRNVAEMFEQDFSRVFVDLAHHNHFLLDQMKNIRVCLKHPDIFMEQLIADDLLDHMLSASQEERVEAWRRAKKVFPWLKT
ncbi:CHC2 zinc finger domain-containing protein [Anaerospora hongkongensis]|uniref:CHC2 zinc finger domain-containing protein n=1 Tax=Anaerospora hongkongensis TaxID=244830 RepID=UPI0028964F5C|nr:CHC2 zinc finger domain-containing protein [Anaerospora hongkongensis]